MATDRPAAPSRPFPYHLAVEATLRDTDANGHVNNAVYVTWLEEVRTRYVLGSRGGASPSDVDFILASTDIRYRSAVELHEVVDLYCAPSRVGTKSWAMTYEARARRDGRLVMDADTVLVQYDYDDRRSIPIRDDLRVILERDLVERENR